MVATCGISFFRRVETLKFSPNMTLQVSEEYPMMLERGIDFSSSDVFIDWYSPFAPVSVASTISRNLFTGFRSSSTYITHIANCFAVDTSVVSSGMILNCFLRNISTNSFAWKSPTPWRTMLVHLVAPNFISCRDLASWMFWGALDFSKSSRDGLRLRGRLCSAIKEANWTAVVSLYELVFTCFLRLQSILTWFDALAKASLCCADSLCLCRAVFEQEIVLVQNLHDGSSFVFFGATSHMFLYMLCSFS